MIIFVHSQVNAESLTASLGLPQYSYYFVLKKFLPVLETLGTVIQVAKSEEINALVEKHEKLGEHCIFLAFCPPDFVPLNINCPTITVFAWEFSNLPYEVWNESPQCDWRFTFKAIFGAIPLSRHCEKLVKTAMGDHYPVKAIPVPLFDIYEGLRKRQAPSPVKRSISLAFPVNVIDSRNYVFGESEFYLPDPIKHFRFERWLGQPLEMSYRSDDEFSAYLGGFYPAEPWGAWSRIRDPWVLVPAVFAGRIALQIECAGYGHNINRQISVSCGNQIRTFTLSAHFETHQFTFDVSETTNIIRFHGLTLDPLESAVDPRSMGLGLKKMVLTKADSQPERFEQNAEFYNLVVTLDGIIYTSIFNPADHRKNWKDIVTAFCFAFRECNDATLILKFTHRSLASFIGQLHYLLEQVQPFRCRVIALHGFIDDTMFEQLIGASSYYVNASTCEGLCLPIMEFMSCGVPALAPRNTAMEDYVSESTNFIIDSSEEPTIWPHDPRHMIRTLQHRIDWESIVNAFVESYRVAKNDEHRYMSMANGCIANMNSFCSSSRVADTMRAYLHQLTY